MSTGIAALFNVLANTILIPLFAIRGAAIATFASYCALAVISTAASLTLGGLSLRRLPGLPVLLIDTLCVSVIVGAGYSLLSFVALLVIVGTAAIFLYRNRLVYPAAG